MVLGDLAVRALRARSMRAGAALAIIAAIVSDAASAQTLEPATVTVSDFAPVVLDGTATATTATMDDFTVTEPVGDGWHVMVRATQFAEVNGAGEYVAGGRTLPAGSLAMPAPTVTPSGPAVTVAPGPYLIDGADVQIVTVAAANPGTFDVTQGGALTLSLPASTYAARYRSEVTVSVHSGP